MKISHDLDDIETLIDGLKRLTDEVGAIAIFIGVVRGKRNDEKVLRLEYEAYEELASKVAEKIIEDSKTKYGIIDACIQHRIGTVKVGGDIMYVLVASKHRAEAFQALSEIGERIKRELPIWKKEVTEKGSYWVENV